MKNVVLGLGAAALAVAPIAASANESVSLDRAVAPVEEGSNVAGASNILIAIFAAAAVIGGVVIASDGGGTDEDDLPVSG